jgi:hypothetical protein
MEVSYVAAPMVTESHTQNIEKLKLGHSRIQNGPLPKSKETTREQRMEKEPVPTRKQNKNKTETNSKAFGIIVL